ncbi:putative Anucleate primary sterigmata protein B [Glarea lozoyensis 74030]|uniref:Putative Anucleate primary sterigmata protein B n=1 Tax=Glarea lozoyensis (strain ATCC 74030 / MF5533) TaxID=1104152 RepID=H0EPE7_GLAL7|nr:putative Anucleate primary sterigmata protein B [Glarea lozoyensis 74030]
MWIYPMSVALRSIELRLQTEEEMEIHKPLSYKLTIIVDQLLSYFESSSPSSEVHECDALKIVLVMAEEDEGHSTMSMVEPGERPQTARKDSRKVPGGFGIDDVDDLSPTKQTFDESGVENTSFSAQDEGHRKPSLDPASLPSLPAPTDSSLYYNQSEDGDKFEESLDETAMERHLNDVESSFMPVHSPISVVEHKGADDTFLFDGAQESRPVSELPVAKTRTSEDLRETPPGSPPSSPSNYKTPFAGDSTSSANEESSNTTSAMESMSSSPTAAAAARTVSRALSTGSVGTATDGHPKSAEEAHSDYEEDFYPTPRKPSNNSLRGVDGTLAVLTEEEQNRERRTVEDISPPETPRAAIRSIAAPTDTIIARHVRNVQVPESLAKEYRNKSGVPSPNKRSGFTSSSLGRTGKNLTLKEQSSTIERLSKENFDLKLKVMFLSDRLDKLSEEGVREMISENVELKTGLAVMQRDNKALKRKVKELEKRLQDDEERPSTARSGTSTGDPSPKWFDQEGAQEREEELLYLRERVEEYVTEIEKLRNDSISRENEKRHLAEVVRSMGERRGQNMDAREEMDVWKDMLEQEMVHREQADEENKTLREEIFRLKTETIPAPGLAGLNHTTNIYNITKKRQISPSRPRSVLSEERADDRTGAFSAASTVVEDLRQNCEQLRHENAELRREVGAQTAMLTSRNREKERLHQEIEDLKMLRRGGAGSVAGDSILDRSASRAHVRSASRSSAVTRVTTMTDAEREDYENKTAELRDRINSLKIHNQDLQRELESCMEDFETAVEQKKQAEALASEMQEALETAEADLLTMQTDRDEALQGQEEAEIMFESLRKEAQEELDGFAAEAEEAQTEIERLQAELADTTENFNSLQNEMREMSEGVVRLEDEHENQTRRIQDLEHDLEEANRELEQMEKNLVDVNGKNHRLTVQQESSQGEIAFLREEQDGDKIKIGHLEAANRAFDQGLREERERVRELEERLAAERHQREVVAGKEKQEVQQYINELNRETSTAKDEIRRLKKTLNSREVEAAEWKLRLQELENNLREALGDLNGTRSSLLTVTALTA